MVRSALAMHVDGITVGWEPAKFTRTPWPRQGRWVRIDIAGGQRRASTCVAFSGERPQYCAKSHCHAAPAARTALYTTLRTRSHRVLRLLPVADLVAAIRTRGSDATYA